MIFGENYNQTLKEIELLIRSKRTIINIITSEEQRVISALNTLCSKLTRTWLWAARL